MFSIRPSVTIRHTARLRIAALIASALLGLSACSGPGENGATGGVVRLSWMAPTGNTDGSALTDLAGFRVYYGLSAAVLNSSIDVQGADTQSITVNSLSPGIYYFNVTAYSSSGAESEPSATISATVQ